MIQDRIRFLFFAKSRSIRKNYQKLNLLGFFPSLFYKYPIEQFFRWKINSNINKINKIIKKKPTLIIFFYLHTNYILV